VSRHDANNAISYCVSLTASVCGLIGFSSILGEDMDFIFFTFTSRRTLGKFRGEFFLCKFKEPDAETVKSLSNAMIGPYFLHPKKKKNLFDMYSDTSANEDNLFRNRIL
jgi:hypothetical protein